MAATARNAGNPERRGNLFSGVLFIATNAMIKKPAGGPNPRAVRNAAKQLRKPGVSNPNKTDASETLHYATEHKKRSAKRK